MGFRHWASTPPVSKRSRQSATGPPGGYPDRTHTGKRRRADDTRSTTYTANLLSLGARKALSTIPAHRRAPSPPANIAKHTVRTESHDRTAVEATKEATAMRRS